MTALLVIGGLLALLALACFREARSGKPAWCAHLGSETPSASQAAKDAKKGMATTVVLAAFLGVDGGDG